jgi:hypothetical protein
MNKAVAGNNRKTLVFGSLILMAFCLLSLNSVKSAETISIATIEGGLRQHRLPERIRAQRFYERETRAASDRYKSSLKGLLQAKNSMYLGSGRFSGNAEVASAATVSQNQRPAKPGAVSATFTVTTTADNGNNVAPTTGSLRKAIIDANNNPELDNIAFNILGVGVVTITPPAPLPDIIGPVVIDGTTQPGFSGAPRIELNGINAGISAHGLTLNTGSSGSTIKGLIFNRFDGYGIIIFSNSNLVQGNYVGIDSTGNVALGNVAGGIGLFNGASNNTIGGTTASARNVVSGNLDNGLALADTTTSNNIIRGNYIGSTASGMNNLPNGSGIQIFGGAHHNTIGGTTLGARNIISGNVSNGINISGTGTTNNQVQGNYIGLTATGSSAMGNRMDGIFIGDEASNNLIGGTVAGARNIISGNDGRGIFIQGNGASGASGNQIQGNYVGTDVSGATAIGNGSHGITFSAGANNNIIGGTQAGSRNLISGNIGSGILLQSSGTSSNQIQGNYIGTNTTGDVAIGNRSNGVMLFNGAGNNTIGGTAAGARNIISGNSFWGILFQSSNTSGNHVQGNFIGTTVNGDGDLGNGGNGIYIFSGANNNTIGGTTAGAGNLISGNEFGGLRIGTSGNTVQGNYIGLKVTGDAALGNNGPGVEVEVNGINNLIGGTIAGARNIISANAGYGIVIFGQGTSANTVQGNYIGTNATGDGALGNLFAGVGIVAEANNNTIGGTVSGSRNIISGNQVSGVFLSGSNVNNNAIQGNYIGMNATGNNALSNGHDGILIQSGANNNSIGGTSSEARNVISGNGESALRIEANSNQVRGNYIGTNASGTAAVPNLGQAGAISITGASNVVGGAITGAGNLISGNANIGIYIAGSGADGNFVQGNRIGTNPDGTGAIPNQIGGVGIFEEADNNTVGGTSVETRNIISGNFGTGVTVAGNVQNNRVQGNFIGTTVTGNSALGNSGPGLVISNTATATTIGGTTAGTGNLIAFNGQQGVYCATPLTLGNSIRGNSIHSNSQLGIDLIGDGVTANDSGDSDTGPNNLQNYPVITVVNTTTSSITIQGTLNSMPLANFNLDFYSNAAPDPSGFGEGQNYLGTTTVSTDNAGNASFNVTFNISVPTGHLITATATDSANNTSEFSRAHASAPTLADVPIAAVITYDNGTLIKWQTGIEVNNLGFNVYRQDTGSRTLLTPNVLAGSALVVGQGVKVASGFTYSWWDSTKSDDAQYWLEDLDLDGTRNWHGPYFPQKVAGTAPDFNRALALNKLGNLEQNLTSAIEPQATLPRSVNSQIAGTLHPAFAAQGAIKLSIKQAGFYRLTAREIFTLGWTSKIDPRRFQMFVDGKEMAIRVAGEEDGRFDPDDSLEFYGIGLSTPLTDARTYWLVQGKQAGKRLQTFKGDGPPSAATGFTHTVERRDRTIYFSALLNGEQENFFGPVIGNNPLELTLDVQHLDPAASKQASLEISLQGVTRLAHQVTVSLNGNQLGILAFNEQAQGQVRFSISQSLLREGRNQVQFLAQGGASDLSLFDAIRLTYQHTFTADQNGLQLTAPANQKVTIDGFTHHNLRVFDITNPDSITEMVGKIQESGSGFAITVAAPGNDSRTLFAVADDNLKRPASIVVNKESHLRSANNEADLLILTHSRFAPSAAQLKAYKEKLGFAVVVADAEDVYDEFSFGHQSVAAIREFIRYAKENWKTKPRYLLLLGDASYDPKNYLGFNADPEVPTQLIDTRLMETASDDKLADFNNDGLPELAVGRLPAHTDTEAAMLIKKIISYENSRPSQELLLVADQNDSFNFEQANLDLQSLIPGTIKIRHLNRGGMDIESARKQLFDALNHGQKIVNYFGHGNVNQWRGNLLTATDAAQLMNADHLSLFVMMTCLNGYFQEPVLDSLAESLLKSEQGGAIAVWASTGMTTPDEQAAINQQLYRLLFAQGQTLPLGEMIRRVKASTGDADIRQSWVLLGDPTLRLR